MNGRSVRIVLVLFVVSLVAGYGATYAWQREQRTEPVETPTNPAEVLGGWLQLMPAQIEEINAADAGFPADRVRLEAELERERTALAVMFDDADASSEDILAQVERVIAAHDALERRVAQYLVAIRPHLSDAQRTQLFERCAEGVREASGYRWRHGQRQNETNSGNARPGVGRGRGRGHGPPWREQTPDAPSTNPSSGD